MLKIELTNAILELKKKKAKKIFLQIPEGLKINAESIIEQLEERGFEVFTSMDPCYGACDIKQNEANTMGCDTILHLGHSSFIEKTKNPIVYAPLHYELGNEFDKTVKNLITYLNLHKIKKVGLTTTVQFLEYLKILQQELKENKIEAIIGKGKRTLDGQILGCNYTSANVKANTIIYLGDGLFHPLGIHYATKKRVLLANPFDSKIKELTDKKNDFLKKRILLIERAKEATNFAILVSTKEGQNKINEAKKIKKELEKAGKGAKIYTMDYITNDTMLGVNAEAFINTACPRISIDDFMQYKHPIINKTEIPYLLGKKNYENYKLELVY